ncbi:DUF3137 domain-containing protein [Empedobacter sedimenti]|uniref:DUF3137 domain-containing protein n=1 Tax=Empedobacter sedimenti TaxID=3042610 RepID=UPI0024A666A6|nr:DUF3137 domain-containing protein [Empedobacter sedimenti]
MKKNKEFRNTTVLREDFKIKILPTFIQQKYPNLRYYFDGMVNENYINDSGFFTKPVVNLKENWFLGDDYFIGKLNNVELEFCELYYKSTGLTVGGWAVLFLSIKAIFSLGINGKLLTDLTDLFGSDKTSQAPQKQQKDKYDNSPFLYGTKTNFRGFFLYADFHKDFDATVKIKRKKMIRGNFLNFNTNLHKIRIENALVNKKYDVFTDNTQLAYYVLSPSIIDAIENVNKILGTNLNMTLKNGKLFLMIPYNNDFFENISIEKDRIIAKSETDIQDELNVISQLITELNISNRIWSKV